MAGTPAGPIVPVAFDESAIAEDLAHHTTTARNALDVLRREVDSNGGLPFSRGSSAAKPKDGTEPSSADA